MQNSAHVHTNQDAQIRTHIVTRIGLDWTLNRPGERFRNDAVLVWIHWFRVDGRPISVKIVDSIKNIRIPVDVASEEASLFLLSDRRNKT